MSVWDRTIFRHQILQLLLICQLWFSSLAPFCMWISNWQSGFIYKSESTLILEPRYFLKMLFQSKVGRLKKAVCERGSVMLSFAERFNSVEWGEASTTDMCSRRTSESCSEVRNTSGFGMVNCWLGVVFMGVLVQVDTGVRFSSSRARIRDKWWKLGWNGKRVGLLSLQKRYIGVISFPSLTEVRGDLLDF